MSPEDMTAVVRLAHERGIWVISDECYVYLNYTAKNFSVGSLSEYRDRFLVVGSLSKTYAMTGWRLGFTLAPAAIIAAVQKLQSQSTSNPTSIVQKAAVAALKGPQQCVDDMRAEYIKLRDHMVEGLRSIPGCSARMPEGAFYAYPNVSAFFGKSGMNSAADVAGKLAARGARRDRSRRRLRDEGARPHFVRDVDGQNWTADWSACGNSSAGCKVCMCWWRSAMQAGLAACHALRR